MNYIAFISLLLSIFSPLAIDLYISTIPNITNEFSRNGELTLSLYLIGVGVGYFFAGKFYDDYGAHKNIIFNLLLYSFTSVCIFLSKNFDLILLLRFIQGVAISGIAVTYTVLLKDNFTPKETAKYYGYTHSIMNIAPATMPFLGIYLTDYYGDWRYSFLVLFVFSLLTMILIFKHTKKIPITTHQKEGFAFLKNAAYKKYSLLAMLSLSMLLTYVTTSPNLFINDFKWTSHEFSIFFAINGLFLAIGGIIFAKLIKKFEILKILKISYLITIISGIIICSGFDEYSYILGICLFSLFFPSMIASSTILSLSELKSDNGKAVALINGFQMIFSGIFGWLFGLLKENLILYFGIFITINGLYGIIKLIENKGNNKNNKKDIL